MLRVVEPDGCSDGDCAAPLGCGSVRVLDGRNGANDWHVGQSRWPGLCPSIPDANITIAGARCKKIRIGGVVVDLLDATAMSSKAANHCLCLNVEKTNGLISRGSNLSGIISKIPTKLIEAPHNLAIIL